MSVESDGIGESFDEQSRIAAMAAMQVGSRLARSIAEQRRVAQQQSDQERIQLQQRLEAERRSAVTELSVVSRSEWWDDAKPQDIGDKYAVAYAYKDEDPQIARAEEHMRRELYERYGFDPREQQQEDPQRVQQEIERIEANRNDPSRQIEAPSQNQPAESEGQRSLADQNRQDRGDGWSQQELAEHYEKQSHDFERMAGQAETPEERRDLEQRRIANQTKAEEVRAMSPEQFARTQDGSQQGIADAERVNAAVYDEQAKDAQRRAEESQRLAESETDPDKSRQYHEEAAREQAQADKFRGDSAAAYDSAERRQADADQMSHNGGDQAQIDTAMRNDVAQARPARDAVQGGQPGRSSTTAQGRGRGMTPRGPQRTR